MTLTDEMKAKIDAKVESIEIDESELEFATYDPNIYGVEPQLAVGGYIYDEDEYRHHQINELLDWLKEDYISDYIDFGLGTLTDEQEEELNAEAKKYLESQL